MPKARNVSRTNAMKLIYLSAAFMLLASPLKASEPDTVVTPLLSTSVTASGQPIVLPQNNPQVLVSIYEIAPGAVLPEHKHIYLRYGYVLAGTLRVTYTETGKSDIYGPGDFILETIERWHQGTNTGIDPVKLLVIDQTEKDKNNVILRE
jgi:quercetin dioxygenase-like cupin family protein